MTSTSRHLKIGFETNLGFNIRTGKKRRRVVLIPADWVKVEEQQPKGLIDFIDTGDSQRVISVKILILKFSTLNNINNATKFMMFYREDSNAQS